MKSTMAQKFDELKKFFNARSFRHLGEILGVNHQIINDLSRGKTKTLSLKTYNALKSKGINPEWLLGNSDTMEVVSYDYEHPFTVVNDPFETYGIVPNIEKMNADEMQHYYKMISKHFENIKNIEEYFKLIKKSLND